MRDICDLRWRRAPFSSAGYYIAKLCAGKLHPRKRLVEEMVTRGDGDAGCHPTKMKGAHQSTSTIS